MTEYGKHKAVLWGKLVTTAPDGVEGCCNGCAFEDYLGRPGVCDEAVQRASGFSPCDTVGCIYVEAQPDEPSADEAQPDPSEAKRPHSHYFKSVAGLSFVDVYRVLSLFEVTDPCLQHAVKKLLCAGNRGSKDQARDVQEAIDSLCRWVDMRREDGGEF